jgi:hypothetical protein
MFSSDRYQLKTSAQQASHCKETTVDDPLCGRLMGFLSANPSDYAQMTRQARMHGTSTARPYHTSASYAEDSTSSYSGDLIFNITSGLR